MEHQATLIVNNYIIGHIGILRKVTHTEEYKKGAILITCTEDSRRPL